MRTQHRLMHLKCHSHGVLKRDKLNSTITKFACHGILNTMVHMFLPNSAAKSESRQDLTKDGRWVIMSPQKIGESRSKVAPGLLLYKTWACLSQLPPCLMLVREKVICTVVMGIIVCINGLGLEQRIVPSHQHYLQLLSQAWKSCRWWGRRPCRRWLPLQ